VEQPSADELRLAYRVAARSRATEEHIVRLVTRGEVKFAIWGPGEEIHGTATALALSRVVNPKHFGFVGHYRSGALCSMWCSLNGIDNFAQRMLRQQFSRATDEMSGGRQMVYHLNIPEVGILPIQSPVGMQLGKAAGYALGFKVKGVTDAVTMAIVGDGTTAEGDLHDAMNAISVWKLPTIVMVTDNGVAISTRPHEGRGIVDFEAYAKGFGLAHFSCDGRDFQSVFDCMTRAATYCRDEQQGCVVHVQHLPRFNGHSSAADVTFDLGQDDPIITFGQQLVARGLLAAVGTSAGWTSSMACAMCAHTSKASSLPTGNATSWLTTRSTHGARAGNTSLPIAARA
jgi:TPP-dependent pyruvate/acetoin dehydrogenase alpha subunit